MSYQNYAGVWLAQSDASYDWLTSPSAPVALGAGQDTVKIWQSYTLPVTGVNNLIVFGDGQYASGNDQANVIEAEASHVLIYGGKGDDVFVGSGGSGTTFIVAQGEGDKVIQNFTENADTLRLIGGPLTSFAAVQGAMTQQGSDVVLNDGGTMILFRNTSVGQFQAKDFQLPLNYASLGAPTFSEDFNNPNTIGTNWVDNYGWGGKTGLGSYTLTHNGEQQIYTAPEFQGTGSAPLGLNPYSFNNGVLTISAHPVTDAQSAQMWGYHYASGMIESNFAQTYGYFEMRAELPHGQGLWPAFWLAGDNQKEIDVLEGLGSDTKTAYNAIHSPSVPSLGNASFNPYSDGFHTYGVLWDPQHITYYVDGAPVWQTATPADMNSPMRMIVNLAVGGNWPGSPDASTPWPADMQIDYVRAYNLPSTTTTTPVTTTPVTSTPTTSPVTSTPVTTTPTAGVAGEIVVPGGAGQTLAGTSAADTFVFKALPWSPAHINGFQPGVDRLDVSALFTDGYHGTDPVKDGRVLLFDDGAGGTKVLVDPDGANTGVWPAYVADLAGVSASGLTSASLFGSSSSATGSGATTTTSTATPVTTTAGSTHVITSPAGAGATLAGTSAADTFVFKSMPWTPGHITGFQAGVDHLDISALFTDGYHGTDPVKDGRVLLLDDGAGGTKVLVDPDGPNTGAWPGYVVDVQGVSVASLSGSNAFASAAAAAGTSGSGAATTTSGGATGVVLTSAAPGSVLTGGAGADTLNASQGADTLTGGAGADHFVFQKEPWAPAHITDFTPGTDVLDLRALFTAAGYKGADPVADHYLSFVSDGAGGTKVLFDPDGAGTAHAWPDYIIDLEKVAPGSVHTSDWLFH